MECLAHSESSRPPGELHGAGEIVCRVGANTGTNQVSYCRKGLISRSLRTRSIAGNVPVPLRASAGNKIIGDLAVAHADLNAALRAEMVRTPRLIALAFAANPVSHQISIVEVEVVVDDLPVDELSAYADGCVGGSV